MFIPYLAGRFVAGMTIYVRTNMDASQFFSAVRGTVRGLDANLPLYAMRTINEQVSNSLLTERLVASLSTIFGILATLLATIGLYGVMAYTVARRTREIGIRMALGADRSKVVWLVMHDVALMAAIGIGIGLPGGIMLGRLVRAQLFGLAPTDPATLAAATAILAAVSLLAGYIPARRATSVDPTTALRYE
jgi:ABC-type antimicrobial peptide transport system permease subunit